MSCQLGQQKVNDIFALCLMVILSFHCWCYSDHRPIYGTFSTEISIPMEPSILNEFGNVGKDETFPVAQIVLYELNITLGTPTSLSPLPLPLRFSCISHLFLSISGPRQFSSTAPVSGNETRNTNN